MKWRIPFFDVVPTPEEVEAVSEVVARGWYSQGKQVEKFEKHFERFLGKGIAVAVSSGTAALHLSFLALGLKPGDKVLMPSLTFVACANVVRLMGGEPVFCDIISSQMPTIDPKDIQDKIDSKCKFIVPMHYGGYPCEMIEITKIADKYNLTVIEDACHATGASFNGHPLGSWGELGCFSFYPNKNITTAEGGMIICQDEKLADRIRLLRSHGIETTTWARHSGKSWTYDVSEPGLNYRMDEIRATLGLMQLRRAEEFRQKRQQLVQHYIDRFSHFSEIEIPFEDFKKDSAYHLFVILLPNEEIRDRCVKDLSENFIQTSLHYRPIHMFSAYKSQWKVTLPISEDYSNRAISLPLFPAMRKSEVDDVCDIIGKTLIL